MMRKRCNQVVGSTALERLRKNFIVGNLFLMVSKEFARLWDRLDKARVICGVRTIL